MEKRAGGYRPNLHQAGWCQGNHWAVAHLCDRCGEVAYRLYDYDEPGEGNIQSLKQPEGWMRRFDLTLCPKCAESYKAWMIEGSRKGEE